MKNDAALLECIFGIALLILVIIVCVCAPWYLLMSASCTFIFIGMPAVCDGYLRFKNSTDTGLKKSRTAAMILSFIPGFGHYYLGRKKEGISFVFINGVSLCFPLILFLHVSDCYGYFLFPSIIMLMFNIGLSITEVNRICDSMDLPYEETGFEMELKNTDVAELVLGLIALVCMVSSTYVFITNMASDGMDVVPVYMCAAPYCVLLSLFAIIKLRNVIISHVTPKVT